MGYMEMLKNYMEKGNTKSSNLDQNPDLVEELGYAKPAQMAPSQDQTDKPAANALSSDTKTPPEKKPPTDTGTAATRG